jgi:hypothetical protein
VSPAEELRAAAKRVRELAEKATPSPWLARVEPGNYERQVAPRMSVMHPESERSAVAVVSGVSDVGGGWDAEDWLLQPDAEHIAWNPAVALAVAAWLRAVEHEMDVSWQQVEAGDIRYTWTAALAVARTFLGGAS